MSLRTTDTELHYRRAKEDGSLPGLDKDIRLYENRYWFVIMAAYPHDVIAREHLLIVLKRETKNWWMLSPFEWIGLYHLAKRFSNDGYQLSLNPPSARTVPSMPHIHCYKLWPEFES